MEPIPVYRREEIAKAVDAGASVAEVAKRFAVGESTVRKFLKLRETQGSLEPKPFTGGPEPSLTDEDRQRLRDAVANQPDATLDQLAEICGLDVSIATICRELQKLDLPIKRKTQRARERNEEDVQHERVEWIEQTEEVDPERLIFIDEAGVATNMTRPYGRAPVGERVYTDVPFRHYKSLTVLGGMRLGGADDLPMMVYEGGTTTDRMVEYISGPLSEVLRPNDIVIADNLMAHKANRVKEALAEYGASIWLLPPYSPDLNPIERLWSKIKVTLRTAKATTVDALQTALNDALTTITNSDIQNWFAHSNYLESI